MRTCSCGDPGCDYFLANRREGIHAPALDGAKIMLQMHTDEQLKAMPTRNLYRHFQHIRASVNGFFGSSDDEPIFEPTEEGMAAEEKEYEILDAYLGRVKKELQSRPYQKFNKKAEAQRRREKLGDLRGNRRPRNRHHRKAS